MNEREWSTAIVGGGFAGIAAAISLQRAGIEDFRIFESAPGVGGTWWYNRYPGAEVDTPSLVYSFSFRPSVWSRTHVQQDELLQYLEDVVDEYGLRSRFRFNSEVSEVEWDASRARYELRLADGETAYARSVISAVGFLNDPKYPTWPGLESFRGPKFHTSRWEAQHDLRGKRVAVVGTGSTAVQVVPAVAESAAHVTVFQREPGWVVPKYARHYTAAEREALQSRIAQRLARTRISIDRQRVQSGARAFRAGTLENLRAQRFAEAYIDRMFADRPDLREAVTPRYPYGGKRPILSDDFYPSLLRDNVTLVPHAVERVTPNTLVDKTGQEHPTDILVMSTGFTPADFLSTLRVVGPGGVSLHDAWASEPSAFLGMMVPGFPNFFMMYGPNTNGGALVTHLEVQADYIAAAIRGVVRGRYDSVEVRRGAAETFNKALQKRIAGTVWETANNYYRSPTGRVVTEWPDGAFTYALLGRVLRRAVWKTRRAPNRAAPLPVRAGRAVQGATP